VYFTRIYPRYLSPKFTIAMVNTTMPCLENYGDEANRACIPSVCGRATVEEFLSHDEAQQLRSLAEAGMRLGGGGTGGPSVLDLISGAVSKGDHFIDVYKAYKSKGRDLDVNAFSANNLRLYCDVIHRVQQAVQSHFKVSQLYLSAPTFFSRIRGDLKPRTVHDQ